MKKGDRFTFKGTQYKCISTHDHCVVKATSKIDPESYMGSGELLIVGDILYRCTKSDSRTNRFTLNKVKED